MARAMRETLLSPTGIKQRCIRRAGCIRNYFISAEKGIIMFCNGCNNSFIWLIIILIILFGWGGNGMGCGCGCNCECNNNNNCGCC